MSTLKLLTLATAVAALSATTAMARFPNAPSPWPVARVGAPSTVAAKVTNLASLARTQKASAALIAPDGFEYVGGDTGWQLAQHKLEYRGGRVAHAGDCPVSIAKAGGNLTNAPIPGA
jgi:hypothetical protein